MVDPLTISELWRRHADRLLLIARAIGEPAEDGVQEAFVALSQQTTTPDDALAWLVRTTRNAMLQTMRQNRRRVSRERALLPATNWFVDHTVAVDGRLDGKTMTDRLRELPADQREIIVMHLWGEMTFRQIAEATEQSAATACRRYQQGISTLQKQSEQSLQPEKETLL